MALLSKIYATVMEGDVNFSVYCWYRLEGVWLPENNAWLLDDDCSGVTVDGSVRQE